LGAFLPAIGGGVGYGIGLGAALGPGGAALGAILGGTTCGIISAIKIIKKKQQTFEKELESGIY
jgi:Na+-driven multidrug efflux pump